MKLSELATLIASARSWKAREEQGAWILTIPLPGGRHQDVTLAEFDSSGAALVRFTTQVASAAALDAKRMKSALELNARLPHGTFAISGGFLVMTDTRPLGTTTPATSAEAIAFLAAQADRYEGALSGEDAH